MDSSLCPSIDSATPPAPFRLAIIGPGALGTLLAIRLVRSNIETVLLDYRTERAQWLNDRDLRLEEASAHLSVRVPVTADPHRLAEVDAALVLVKAYRTEAVGATLAAFLPPSAAVLTLQNGLGNVETLQWHLGDARVFGGTIAQGALLVSPGVVRDTGGGPIIVGRMNGQDAPRLDAICQALLRAGFAVSMTDDLPAAIWHKTILNAAINPVGALTHLRNGQLGEHAYALQMMTAAAREAFQVARAHGIRLQEQDWRARLRTICQATAANNNSMLQDILSHRPTEIQAINGAIVRIAEEHHLQTPINRTLWYLVSALEEAGSDPALNAVNPV
jgi:2-dehydropantoate 2-reductase